MRVGELIKELSEMNQDAEVRVGMWFGPGSPEVQTYEVDRIGEFDPENSDGRYGGPHIVWIAGVDIRRRTQISEPSEALKRAQRLLRNVARCLGDLAGALEPDD